MFIRLSTLVSILTGCNIHAGFAVDPFHDTMYSDSPIRGVVRVSHDVEPNGQFYYEHISDPTTNDDRHGQNLFGFNYRFFGSKQCHK